MQQQTSQDASPKQRVEYTKPGTLPDIQHPFRQQTTTTNSNRNKKNLLPVMVVICVALVVAVVRGGGVHCGRGGVVVVFFVSVVGRALVMTVVVGVRVRILLRADCHLEVLEFGPECPNVPPENHLLGGRQSGKALFDVGGDGFRHIMASVIWEREVGCASGCDVYRRKIKDSNNPSLAVDDWTRKDGARMGSLIATGSTQRPSEKGLSVPRLPVVVIVCGNKNIDVRSVPLHTPSIQSKTSRHQQSFHRVCVSIGIFDQ